MPQDFWDYGEPYASLPDRHRPAARAWSSSRPRRPAGARRCRQGEGLGIAVHRSFVSYIATVVHCQVDEDGKVRVPEVHVAIDCGFVANPERVRSQMQGAA